MRVVVITDQQTQRIYQACEGVLLVRRTSIAYQRADVTGAELLN